MKLIKSDKGSAAETQIERNIRLSNPKYCTCQTGLLFKLIAIEELYQPFEIFS